MICLTKVFAAFSPFDEPRKDPSAILMMAPAKAKCVRPATKPQTHPPNEVGRTTLTRLRDHFFAARPNINLVKLAPFLLKIKD